MGTTGSVVRMGQHPGMSPDEGSEILSEVVELPRVERYVCLRTPTESARARS